MSGTYSRDMHSVACPHCGEKNNLADLYMDLHGPEDAEVNCVSCEKLFDASFHVSISVTTSYRERKSLEERK